MAEVDVGGLDTAIGPWSLDDEGNSRYLEHVFHVAPIAAGLEYGRCTAIRQNSDPPAGCP